MAHASISLHDTDHVEVVTANFDESTTERPFQCTTLNIVDKYGQCVEVKLFHHKGLALRFEKA
jgi:hypothetical protein